MWVYPGRTRNRVGRIPWKPNIARAWPSSTAPRVVEAAAGARRRPRPNCRSSTSVSSVRDVVYDRGVDVDRAGRARADDLARSGSGSTTTSRALGGAAEGIMTHPAAPDPEHRMPVFGPTSRTQASVSLDRRRMHAARSPARVSKREDPLSRPHAGERQAHAEGAACKRSRTHQASTPRDIADGAADNWTFLETLARNRGDRLLMLVHNARPFRLAIEPRHPDLRRLSWPTKEEGGPHVWIARPRRPW